MVVALVLLITHFLAKGNILQAVTIEDVSIQNTIFELLLQVYQENEISNDKSVFQRRNCNMICSKMCLVG